MPNMVWAILGVVAIILLIVFWSKRSAVWGGLTIGLVVGLMIAVVYLLKENGFSLIIVGKGAILGVLAGFVAELLAILPTFIKKRTNK